MKRVGWTLVGLLATGLAYLCLWPVPVDPVAWDAPASPGYTGVHTPNELLANLNIIPLGGEVGPEHVAVGHDGKLYAAVVSGDILRMNADGSALEVFVNTGGRVLGFDFDAAGNLIAADAIRGLLSVAPDRRVAVLVDRFGGAPILYADAVVVAADGRIYFSDASARFGPARWGGTFEASILDIIEQSCSGRILEYDPPRGTTRVVARRLCFANGVALSRDEQTLFVAETGKYRVWKVALAAENLDVTKPSPLASVLLDNLPGYPDNLMRGRRGTLWLGLSKPRSAAVDAMAPYPFLRKLTLRLPRAAWPVPKPYGHVMQFTEDGRPVAVLQDPSGAYPETTGVTETAERLYIQSLHAHGLGWLPR